ncbi:hypothetical protein D917_04258 [Trichinella nativa]|uniref:Uncharacterized protein n=1 Tax=Trichinella nativa TaxID=6335 RepID=A0A1Y3E519_9BILA|nr:hypothetical protein D917_04258 [Trichinella nativa]
MSCKIVFQLSKVSVNHENDIIVCRLQAEIELLIFPWTNFEKRIIILLRFSRDCIIISKKWLVGEEEASWMCRRAVVINWH